MTSAATAAAQICPHPAETSGVLYDAIDYISGDRFTLVRCGACGLVLTSPRPADSEMAAYYPPGYHAGRRYRGALELLPRLLMASRAKWLGRENGGPGRVLEIGCGRGALLNELRSRGWQVTGTELNESAARFARENYGLDVRTQPVARLDLAPGTLDTVILWHVLEHLANPQEALIEATALLRPGGLLLVGVPRFDGPLSRWARAGWFQLDVPRHVNHFSSAALLKALDQAGVQPLQVRHLCVEYDFFSFVQTTLNRAGFRMNLFFESLRPAEATMLGETQRRHAGKGQRLASLLLALPLTAASLVWQPIQAARKRGDTITVLARKPALTA